MTLDERIRRAVSEGRKARSAHYAAIDLPDEQELGPPAAEADLRKLEARLGRPLPPSYRAFLSLHDGWRMASGAMDLLSVREMLEGPVAAGIRKWQDTARRAGDAAAAEGLVIGLSSVTATRLLLDPRRPDADGEWPVIQHCKGEEGEYPSFLAWLEESAEEFRELLREEQSGGG